MQTYCIEEIFYNSGPIESREWSIVSQNNRKKYPDGHIETYYEHGHVRKVTYTNDDK